MSDGTHIPLNHLLRQRRKELGLTLENLAEKVGLTPGALSHIESGRRLPDPRNALRIAGALELPEEDVLRSLDEAHALRRRTSAYEAMPSSGVSRAQPQSSAVHEPTHGPSFRAMPIDRLFAARPAPPTSGPEAARNLARWSDDTSERIEAIDRLADTAADAIRTLRGLLEDDDPLVQREARRLLRELDVRMPEE